MALNRSVGDRFVLIGFLLQVGFLLLVDVGSIAAFARAPVLPWAHVAGLVVVNIVLGTATVIVWRWLRRGRT